jgi:hypothetical protein
MMRQRKRRLNVLPYFVCDNCGHSMLEDSDCVGHKSELKTRGWLIDKNGTTFQICSICLQVEITINKDSLFDRGYRELFFGNMDATKETAKYGYEILPEDPWLKQIRPKKEETKQNGC